MSPRHGLTGLLGGAGSRALDQFVNSASSAAFSLGTVLVLPASSLGVVALQMIVISLALGILRSAVFEAALFVRDGDGPNGFAWIMPRVGLWCAAPIAAAMAALGLAFDQLDAAEAVATAAVGAAILLVDGLRYAAIALDRVNLAVRCDSAWLGGFAVLGAAGLVTGDGLTYRELALAYAVAGVAASGTVTHPVLRLVRHAPRSAPRALRRQGRFGWEFLLQIVPGQLVLAVAPIAVGLEGLGRFRAIVTLYQPLVTSATAVRLAAVGGSGSAGAVAARLRRTVVLLVSASAAYTAVVTVLVDPIGWLARGALRDVGAALLLAYGVGELCRVGMQPVFDLVRLAGHFARLMRLRSVQAVVLVVGSAAAGMSFGVGGLVAARVLAYGLPVPLASRLSPRDEISADGAPRD